MKLFFYILKEFFRYAIGAIVLSMFIFILFDFIHKTTKYFARYNPSSQHIIEFYLYQIPSQIVQAFPIASLLASVITMVLLSRSNEVTAMRASGMSPMAIGFPLAAGGLILSGCALVLGEFVVPLAAKRMHYVQQVLIEGQESKGIADGARWVRSEGNLFSFRNFDSITNTMSEVRLVEVGDGFRPRVIWQAASAAYKGGNTWDLTSIVKYYLTDEGEVEHIEHLPSKTIDVPMEPSKLRRERRKPNELSMAELRGLITRGEQLGADVLPFRVELHIKFAYPFAALVVSLIGLKFGYRSERATETVKGMLLAFVIGLSYWFFLSAARALGLRGDLHPMLAAWSANIVVLIIASAQIWRSQKV